MIIDLRCLKALNLWEIVTAAIGSELREFARTPIECAVCAGPCRVTGVDQVEK